MSHGREILSSIPSGDVQIRKATLMHLETIVGFNAAMAKETEGKELDIGLLRSGVRPTVGNTRGTSVKTSP